MHVVKGKLLPTTESAEPAKSNHVLLLKNNELLILFHSVLHPSIMLVKVWTVPSKASNFLEYLGISNNKSQQTIETRKG